MLCSKYIRPNIVNLRQISEYIPSSEFEEATISKSMTTPKIY